MLISGQLDEAKFSERPYDVLQNQNLGKVENVRQIVIKRNKPFYPNVLGVP